MSATLSSEQALNGIFNSVQMIEHIINKQQDKKDKQKNGDIDDTLKNLNNPFAMLKDIKDADSVGKQFEKLAKGLDALAKVDVKPLESISDVLVTVTNTLKSFKDLEALDMDKVIDNVKKLDKKLITKLTDFIKTLNEELKGINNSKELAETVQNISQIFNALNSVVSASVLKLNIGLSWWRAKMLGWTISTFVEQIAKALDKKKIDSSIKYIGTILDPITRLADPKNKYSFTHVKNVLNKKLAKTLAQFFITLSDEIINGVDYVKFNMTMDGIYKFFIAMSSKDFNPEALSNKLDPKYTEKITSFFIIFADKLSKINSKKFKQNAEAIQIVLVSFSNHLIKFGWTLMVASMLLSEKRAISINNTIHALIAGKFDKKKLQTVTDFMKQFGVLLMVFAGVLISVVLLITLAPIASVIAGVMLIKYGVNFIKKLIIELTTELNNKDVKTASSMIKSLSMCIVAITSMVALIAIITSLFGFGTVLGGVAVVGLVLVASYFFIKKLSDKKFMEGTKDSMKTVKSLALLIFALTVAVGILAFVSTQVEFTDLLIGVATLTLMLAAMIGIVKLMSAVLTKKVQDNAINSLKSLTWIMLGVGLIAAIILPMITKNIGAAIVGAIFVGVLIALMIGGVYLLSKIEEKNLQKATTSLMILTGILLAVSLIALFILPSLSKKIVETFGGIFVVSIIIALMIGAVMWLSTIESTNLIKAVSTVAILTGILLAVSLIALFILPKLTKNWDKILKGAFIVAIIIAAMIGGVMWLSTIESTNLINAAATLVIMVGILLGVSLIANYILPSIGKNWLDALIGGGVTLAIVGGMIYLVKLMAKKLPNEILWKALLTLVGMGVILLGVSWITTEYLIPIGAQGAKAIWGAAQVALIIVGMIKIMQWIGKLVKKHAADIAIGAVTVIAVAGVLWAVSKLMDPFVDICLKIHNAPDGSIAKSSGIILLILGSTGLILGALGAILFSSGGVAALVLAAGAAAVLGIAAIIYVVSEVMNSYVDTVNILKPITAQTIKDTTDKGTAVLTGIAEMLENIPFSLLGDLALLPFKLAADTLFSILISASVNIQYINNLITKDDIIKFDDLIWKDPENSLLGSLNQIITQIRGFGLTQTIIVRIITSFIKPILDTISYFIDIIMKVAKGNYISGYDSNGKPIYQHIKPSEFGEAATQVTSRFIEFLTKLNEGFEWSQLYTVPLLSLISMTMKPIIDRVSQFVDVVMKVARGTYIIGYDENGKPKFEHVTAQQFGDAGTQVTNRFQEFLQSLSIGFENLTVQSTYIMNLISKNLKPVIDIVGKFVDVVMKVATGTYVTGYDENGKEIYEHLTASEFSDAGKQVSYSFMIFLIALSKGFEQLSEQSIDAINALRKSMKPIMESVSLFTDAIIRAVTTQIIVGYDDKDHPIYEQIDIDVFDKAGTSIATNFGNFINTLCDNVKKLDYVKQDALEVMSETMSPIMDSVSKFVDAIIKFASGQYIDYYQQDKDGNYTVPHFVKIPMEDMTTAADKIAECFGTFITSLINAFNKGDKPGTIFNSNITEEALEAISETIQPIMDSVGSYVNAIMMVAAGQVIDGYDKDGKGNIIPKYRPIDIKEFDNAAIHVAGMFKAFIDTLVKEFSNEEFKNNVANISDIIDDSIAPVMESFKNFSEALMPFMGISTGKEDNAILLVMQPGTRGKNSRIEEIGEDIANAYTSFVGTISTWLKANKSILENIESDAEKVNDLMDVVKKTTKTLSEINKLFNSSNENVDINAQMTASADTFISLLNKYNSYFGGEFNINENGIENAKQSYVFLKVVFKVSGEFKKLMSNINNENAETLINNFNNALTIIATKLNDINNQAKDIDNQNIIDMLVAYHQTTVLFKHADDVLKAVNYDYVNQYINTILSLIDNLKTVTAEVKKQDLTAGVNEFIGVMNNLTEIKMNRGVFVSDILIYAQHINTFTVQIKDTSEKLTVYIKTLEKATEALKSLDNQIVNKAKQREEALQRFIDKIDGITEAFGRMTTKFDEFDQNALAQRFDAFRDILGAAGIDVEDKQTDNEGKPIENNTNNYYDTFNSRQRKGTITVQFANKILDGTYTTT